MELIKTIVELHVPCLTHEPSYTCEMKAERARQVVRAWRELDEDSADAVADNSPVGAMELVAVLADLRHLADQLQLCFASIDRYAHDEYLLGKFSDSASNSAPGLLTGPGSRKTN